MLGVIGADVATMGAKRGRAASFAAKAGVVGAVATVSSLALCVDVSTRILTEDASAAAKGERAAGASMASSDGAEAFA